MATKEQMQESVKKLHEKIAYQENVISTLDGAIKKWTDSRTESVLHLGKMKGQLELMHELAKDLGIPL